MAQEALLLSSIPQIEGVVIQVLRSRAVNPDGSPLLPGDLFLWNYEPLDMELVCRVEERVEDPSKGHVQLEFCGEHGEFPMPFVKATDPRVGVTQSPPVDIDVTKVRIWFLPPGLGGGREITALIDRPSTADTGTQLWLSPNGSGPWQEVLDSGFFSALCEATAAIGSGDGTVSISSSSLDFNRMQGQTALAQTNDSLLLLVDNELMSVGSITAAGGGAYTCSVLRARAGTLAAAHAADAPAWLFYNEELIAVTWKEFYNVRTAGVYDAALATKYFKFAAHSYGAVGNLVPANPGFSFVFPDLGPNDSATGVRIFYQDTAPQGQLNVGDLWFDTDDGNREYRWNGSMWVDVSDTRITTVTTGLGTVEATIATVEATLASDIATAEANIATVATNLLAEAATRGAAITTEETTRQAADESLADSITTLTASLAGVSAGLSTEESTRAAADSALASDITVLTAGLASNVATLGTEETTRADADSALASDITVLTATVSGNTAAIGSEETARATGDSALAASLDELVASVSGVSASVDVLTAAYVLDGVAVTTWGIELDSDGKVVGIQAIAASGGTQASTGVIIFSGADLQTDNFDGATAGWQLTHAGRIKAAGWDIGPDDLGRTTFDLGFSSKFREDYGIVLETPGDSTHPVQITNGGSLVLGTATAGGDVGNRRFYITQPDGTFSGAYIFCDFDGRLKAVDSGGSGNLY
jgi:hypothetical protein